MTAPSRRTVTRVPGSDWPPPRWHAEHTVVDGLRWFARISPEQIEGLSSPPVVLLHGLVVSGAYFHPVATRLAETLSVYVPDVPGFGHSANPTRIWDVSATADGLARWMDAHGLRYTVLVANSLGCQIATLLACRRPDLVARLVLIGPTMDPAAHSMLGQLWRGLRDIPHESPALWSIWIPDALRAGPWRALRTLHLGLRDDMVARLPGVTQPTLVVGGENDPIAPPPWVEAIAARLPNGRAIIIPAAPHAINYSAPGDLARIIRVFVAAEGGEGGSLRSRGA